MNASLKRWITTTAERNELINTLTANLTMLRARLSVSQEDIAKFNYSTNKTPFFRRSAQFSTNAIAMRFQA